MISQNPQESQQQPQLHHKRSFGEKRKRDVAMISPERQCGVLPPLPPLSTLAGNLPDMPWSRNKANNGVLGLSETPATGTASAMPNINQMPGQQYRQESPQAQRRSLYPSSLSLNASLSTSTLPIPSTYSECTPDRRAAKMLRRESPPQKPLDVPNFLDTIQSLSSSSSLSGGLGVLTRSRRRAMERRAGMGVSKASSALHAAMSRNKSAPSMTLYPPADLSQAFPGIPPPIPNNINSAASTSSGNSSADSGSNNHILSRSIASSGNLRIAFRDNPEAATSVTSGDSPSANSSKPPGKMPNLGLGSQPSSPGSAILSKPRARSYNYDRFIPVRTADLMAEYYTLDMARQNSGSLGTPSLRSHLRKNTASASIAPNGNRSGISDSQREDANRTYNALLRSELLNDHTVVDEVSKAELLPPTTPTKPSSTNSGVTGSGINLNCDGSLLSSPGTSTEPTASANISTPTTVRKKSLFQFRTPTSESRRKKVPILTPQFYPMPPPQSPTRQASSPTRASILNNSKSASDLTTRQLTTSTVATTNTDNTTTELNAQTRKSHTTKPTDSDESLAARTRSISMSSSSSLSQTSFANPINSAAAITTNSSNNNNCSSSSSSSGIGGFRFKSPLKKVTQKLLTPKKSSWTVPSAPTMVLDAPEIVNDFYLNVLDWSQSTNVLAVALYDTVYLWEPETKLTRKLCTLDQASVFGNSLVNTANSAGNDNWITSIKWIPKGNLLALGTKTGNLELWDTSVGKKVKEIIGGSTSNSSTGNGARNDGCGHHKRIACMSWFSNDVLSTGSRDKTIFNQDLRLSKSLIAKYEGHTQEVCGLSWNPDINLLASGSNDNLVKIWDRRFHVMAKKNSKSFLLGQQCHYNNNGANINQSSTSSSSSSSSLFTFSDHQAAVKALAWSPRQRGVLATGGGATDQHIRFWNAQTGNLLRAFDVKSQVCNIAWSVDGTQLVTTHGYTDNLVMVWKYNTMQPLARLKGHRERVLYMAASPDGQTVVTGSADETLRFWNVFPKPVATQFGSGGSGSIIGGGSPVGGRGLRSRSSNRSVLGLNTNGGSTTTGAGNSGGGVLERKSSNFFGQSDNSLTQLISDHTLDTFMLGQNAQIR
ncbi:substrate-specific activator of APC-dependent proteolysis [Mycoemilia scoparia]|uniref:Substrate-specific activator of APC-dependent proteolysis n=1 Tax=Mycoemilia scoparia TaxID=417184 RepID=A0A9W7ZRU6_9FUNG|nr:substrate-specific activator of APC-dependent proteolysis [Mycoemilia scoparia]